MKKKAITFLLLCMTMAMSAGCGDKKADTPEGTEAAESVIEEGTEAGAVASSDIVYNVDDYVTLGDYMDVSVTLNEADYNVTEDDIYSYADQMIAYYKPYLPNGSKTVVEKGDIVDVDYVGKKDGVAFDGGTAEAQMIDTAQNCDATTGNGYIDGFSDGLIGASVGETLDWEVTFPENYQSEELKGQTVTFTFTVNSINDKVTRENIDDAYVKDNFEAENVEDFYADIRTVLEQQAESGKETDIRSAVIDAVMEKCTVELPEGLLETRLEEYVESFKNQNCSDGTDLDEYLQANYYTTEEQFREQCKIYMEESLKQELVFESIVKKENIEFDEEEFNDYIAMIVENGDFPSEDTLYETYGADKESGKAYLQKVYLQSEACDKIAAQAKVTYEAETEEPTEAEES